MISVITPVYNAERFLESTILSVQNQAYVIEHIVIDDGSTDDSWEIIQAFSKKYKNIIALKHPDKKNHGRSATRNIGIKVAKGDYIAFLDADDYYLENRFENDIKSLEFNKNADGIYNAIGFKLYDVEESSIKNKLKLTTLSKRLDPSELFENMAPMGRMGHFSGDGFLIKKSTLLKCGLFNTKLKVAEDSELWMRLSICGTLIPGNLLKPVAIRGVHANNSFNKSSEYKIARFIMWAELLKWAVDKRIGLRRIVEIKKRKYKYAKRLKKYNYSRYSLICMKLKDIVLMPFLIKVWYRNRHSGSS